MPSLLSSTYILIFDSLGPRSIVAGSQFTLFDLYNSLR
ncbi:hypothetical protein M2265_000623 [Sphingobacterium kitahiroshimense]|nr:hypothetical protein [Sphingobacterium kitahiroshimense]